MSKDSKKKFFLTRKNNQLKDLLSQNELVPREKAKDPQVLGVSPLAPADITVLTMGLDIIDPGTDLNITVLRGIVDMVLNITALEMVLDITVQDMVLGIIVQDMVLDIIVQDMGLGNIVQDMVLDTTVLELLVLDTDHKALEDRVQVQEDIL